MRFWLLVLLGVFGCGTPSPDPAAKILGLGLGVVPSVEQSLAQRFAPIVLLHPEERYLPMSVGEYFRHLHDAKGEEFFTSGRADFERGLVQAAVAQVSQDLQRLQYWFFYPKNGCQGMQIDYQPWGWWHKREVQHKTIEVCNLGRHEGDWERVTIELSPDLAAIRRVFYSQHEGGVWLDAAQAQLEQGRVVVYAALNSHANYPSAEGFHSSATVAKKVLKALTWIDAIRIGDIVSVPTSAASTVSSAPIRWDTAQNLTVWNEDLVAPYRAYLGAWGETVPAQNVQPIKNLPSYLSRLVRTVVPIAFAVVPRLHGKGNGRAPPSPWGRVSWQQFDQAINKDEAR